MRASHVRIPELFHIIWFWEGYAVSLSVLHHFLLLKARFQCILVSFEGPEETSGVHCRVLHFLVLGGGRLCCISVSSPPFFIVKGSFTMYYSVV